MSEMIDRVAEAISRTCLNGCEAEGQISACRPDLCSCRHAARAAIAAMSEPTEAMVDDLARRIVDDEGTAELWRATVAVALAE